MTHSTRLSIALYLVFAAAVALLHAPCCAASSTEPEPWQPHRVLGDKGGREHYRLDDNPWPEAGVTPWLTGLPSLTKTHSPSAEYWSNSIAVCAIMKDENITDVAEWVAYHKWLGVDHIFLTDNNSTGGEEGREMLAAAFPSSFLSLHSEMEPRAQLKVYAWCAEEHRASYNWMAFIDVDEYIVLRGSSKKKGLKKFLGQYKYFGGLSVHWIVVGPSDRDIRPETGGVLPYYQKCHVEPHPAVKTIANTWGNVWSVNEDKQMIKTAWHARPEYREKGGGNAECQREQNVTNCFEGPAVRHRPQVAHKIAIYHYVCKSKEDYKNKLKRGAGLPLNVELALRDQQWFDAIEAGEEEDPKCEEPSKVAQECCSAVYDGTLFKNIPGTNL